VGIKLFSSATYEGPPPAAPNPDPAVWEVVEARQIGRTLIVSVRYPGCTNYEGVKLLVYENVTLEQLKAQKLIDPHFSDDPKFVSPIARFVPTPRGWRMANEFARTWAYGEGDF
jgi:hypothetical protein